ncbi:MAG TPA: TlpA disulfide reductase family protein [Thermoanaerobaculia bacterium]|nr:TlpA disulfide reductase family protein [Thermoanaerobaculia bacterium]
MMQIIERSLVFIAYWGAWVLLGLILLSLVGLWRLGRTGRFFLPAGWLRRAGALLLLVFTLAAGLGLFLLLGPIGPTLAEVRRVHGMVGQPAPDVAFEQVVDGSARRLHDLKGQVVLVNLWATWCPPCRKEMPALDRLQSAYKDRGLVVVNLSDEPRELLQKFIAEHPMSTLHARTSQLGWLDVPGRPLSLVIDGEGVIRECVVGDREYEFFEEAVQPYLS